MKNKIIEKVIESIVFLYFFIAFLMMINANDSALHINLIGALMLGVPMYLSIRG